LAFNKKRANDRKEWLYKYDRNIILDSAQEDVTFNEFIDKELIHFSNASNDRSIPDIRDGFKPSIRKIMYSCFKRNLTSELKVAQLAGYVSENSAYHHGEKSLEGAIVGLAHDFVGSNNLNLLLPVGQFGSRLHGGKDCAQSRYIFTQLSKLTRKMFNPSDDHIYTYLDDDGYKIEPESYCPILPMVLINGSEGIGTGFSSKIPKYNPNDLAKYIKNKLNGVLKEDNVDMHPWYKGFKGIVHKIDARTYITKAVYHFVNNSTVHITELPVGMWTEKYIETLDKLSSVKKNKILKHYTDHSTESDVSIHLEFDRYALSELLSKPDGIEMTALEKYLKLTKTISISNMWLFNKDRRIVKYTSIKDIIEEWFGYRHQMYVKRKDYLIQKLEKELNIIFYKVKFIKEFIDNTIEIRNKSKQSIIDMLIGKEYPKLHINIDDTDEKTKSYDYLLKMNLYTLSKEEVESLTNKRDMKQIELDTLRETTIKKMWIKEVDDFIHLYNKKISKKISKKKSNVDNSKQSSKQSSKKTSKKSSSSKSKKTLKIN